MKKLNALCAVLFVAAPVLAADFPASFTLSWENASQYVDSTPIEAVDLTGVRIQCTRVNDGSPLLTATFVPSGVGLDQSEVFTNAITKAGSYSCVGFTIVSDNTESEASVSVQFKMIGKPNPPSALTKN
jgi:hypothetical protein